MVIKHIDDKTKLQDKVLEALQSFPAVKRITCDNEPGFSSAQFKSFAERMKIQIKFCDPKHSTTNGQIERVHSTIIEIAKCIREEFEIVNDIEVIIRAAQSYNQTVHSVTDKKPFEILYNKVKHDDLPNKLKDAQITTLSSRNKNRQMRTFNENEIIFEKDNQYQSKLKPRYKNKWSKKI